MQMSNDQFVVNAIVAAEELTGAVYVNSETYGRLVYADRIEFEPDEGGRRPMFVGRRVFVDDNLEDGIYPDWSERTLRVYRQFDGIGKLISASKLGLEVREESQPVRPDENFTTKPSCNGKVITEVIARFGGCFKGARS